MDGAVGSAVAEGGLVVVLGEPFAGKSRTALAALATVLPTARVYAPARHVDLRGLPDLLRGRPDRCVLWLDDLDGHLGDGGLEPRLLARLTGRGVVVLATLREDAYDEHRQTSRGRVLDLAQFVELPRSGARRSGGGRRGGDPRLAQAARHSGVEGVAAYLAVAPLLWEEWRRAGRPTGTRAGTRWCGWRSIWRGAGSEGRCRRSSSWSCTRAMRLPPGWRGRRSRRRWTGRRESGSACCRCCGAVGRGVGGRALSRGRGTRRRRPSSAGRRALAAGAGDRADR
ncbi:hypothetical protein O1M54_29605 [Streptomyces diastatochromogenes]|nr:hypothetical protein [Streptomyces diastatochromogenes]